MKTLTIVQMQRLMERLKGMKNPKVQFIKKLDQHITNLQKQAQTK